MVTFLPLASNLVSQQAARPLEASYGGYASCP
jgi:hypothetical protein